MHSNLIVFQFKNVVIRTISVLTGEAGGPAATPARLFASLISYIIPKNWEGRLESGLPYLKYCLPCQEDLHTLMVRTVVNCGNKGKNLFIYIHLIHVIYIILS